MLCYPVYCRHISTFDSLLFLSCILMSRYPCPRVRTGMSGAQLRYVSIEILLLSDLFVVGRRYYLC